MRRALLIAGVVVLVAAWLSSAQLAPRAFFVHMSAHMVVVAVAAPLLALGLAGQRFDPVRKTPSFFLPLPASLLELVVVWSWHAPQLHQLARHHTTWLVAEQGSFILSGFFVWMSAFGGDSAQRRERAAEGVLALLLTSMHMTLLGALLALAPRPLYAPCADSFGLTPLEDQHLGGAIMLLLGGVSYLVGGLYLTAGLLRRAAQKAVQPT
jgi:putative membrane protein